MPKVKWHINVKTYGKLPIGLVPRYADVPTAMPVAVKKSAAMNNKILLINIAKLLSHQAKYDTIYFMKNVGIIAPSGHIEDIKKLEYAESFMESFGMRVQIFPSCYKKFRYMAGDDEIRLKDLHDAYLDKNIDTIICARGGYGVVRLLDKIDYDIIKNNPKKIVGSSDITALLVSIYKKTGQITYHGKMALNGVSNMEKEEFLNYKNSIENNIYNPPNIFLLISFSLSAFAAA